MSEPAKILKFPKRKKIVTKKTKKMVVEIATIAAGVIIGDLVVEGLKLLLHLLGG